MNIPEILLRVFPCGRIGYVAGGTLRAFEVRYLRAGTQPLDCEILDVAGESDPRAGFRREYFLVKTDEVLLYFRISTATADSFYQELAVGFGYADLSIPEEASLLEKRARLALSKLKDSTG